MLQYPTMLRTEQNYGQDVRAMTLLGLFNLLALYLSPVLRKKNLSWP